MRLLVHQMKKDARHLRIFLGIWCLLLVVRYLLLGSGIDRTMEFETLRSAFTYLILILFLLEMMLLAVMVCRLVQSDPLVGTSAFWFTRPISRGALLRSKLLFSLVFLLFPQIAAVAVIALSRGFTVGDLLLTIGSMALFQIVLLVLMLLFAALTSDISRAVLLGVMGTIGFYIVGLGLVSLKNMFWFSLVDPGARTTGSMIFYVVIVLSGFCALVHQYLVRDARRSAAIAVLGALSGLFPLHFWQWGIYYSTANGRPFDSETISLSIDSSSHEFPEFAYVNMRGPVVGIKRRLTFTGAAHGEVIEPLSINSALQLPDGSTFQSRIGLEYGFAYLGDLPLRAEHLKAIQAAVSASTLSGRPYRFRDIMQDDVLRIEKQQYSRLENSVGAYSADIYCRKLKYNIVAEAQLRPDNRLDAGSADCAILDISPLADDFRIILHESSPNQSLAFVPVRPVYYLLRNRSRGEAVLGNYGRSCLGSNALIPQAVEICRTSIRFVGVDQEWLQGATLLRVEPTEIARFSKTVRIENFALKN